MKFITNFFREMNSEDFREFVVFIFGILGYTYLFCVTFIEIPESNHEIRTVGMTLVSTVIFGRMIVEFVNNKKKDNTEDGEDD